jgi:hypothetical protein
MKISPVVQQAIDIQRETASTNIEIATAVAVKQQTAAKEEGKAILQLIEQAAVAPKRGIDVRA